MKCLHVLVYCVYNMAKRETDQTAVQQKPNDSDEGELPAAPNKRKACAIVQPYGYYNSNGANIRQHSGQTVREPAEDTNTRRLLLPISRAPIYHRPVRTLITTPHVPRPDNYRAQSESCLSKTYNSSERESTLLAITSCSKRCDIIFTHGCGTPITLHFTRWSRCKMLRNATKNWNI